MAYGLSNPEYALRRFILWAGTAVVTSSAISESALQSVRSQLEALGISPLIMLLFDVLSVLFLKVDFGWPVITVILFICLLEGLRMAFNSQIWIKDSRSVRIFPATETSFIAKQAHKDNRFVASISFTLSNQTDDIIEISGATSKIMFTSTPGELYSKDQVDEITSKHVYHLGPKRSMEFNMICRNLPTRIENILYLLSRVKLNYLIDITAKISVFGNHGLDGKHYRVTLDFPSRRTVMQQR